jgi:hypothetical protein
MTRYSPLLLLALPAWLAGQQPDVAAVADTVFARWDSTTTPGVPWAWRAPGRCC